jgi:hypothetical protein
MHFVKKFVKKGGRSFDKTAMIKYDQCENAITVNNAYSDIILVSNGRKEDNFALSMNDDFNQLEYDNNKIHLFQKCKIHCNYSFTHVECNYLLDCLLGEVKKVFTNFDDAYQNSSYFRLHCYYTTLLGQNKQFVLFDDKAITNFKDFLFNIYLNQQDNNNNNNVLHSINSNTSIILCADEILTARSIFFLLAYQKNFNIYTKAVIYGLRFTARGLNYIENENATADNYSNYGKQGNFYTMNNQKNNLKTFSNWSTQYSSWCRYKVHNLKFNDDKNNNPSIYYGQLNYFFRIYCENDRVLHGLPIANLVPRNYLSANTLQNPFGVDKISCETLFHIPRRRNDDRNCFVPLTNFYPTAILVVPFDECIEGKPIYIKKDNVLPEYRNFYSESNEISYFLAFDLHSNKKYSHFDPLKQKRYNKFSVTELDEIYPESDESNDDDSSDKESSNNENDDS